MMILCFLKSTRSCFLISFTTVSSTWVMIRYSVLGFFICRVSLRDQSDEEAVLCTSSKTYAVKFVGTSNSVFLVPPSDPSESSETASDEPVVASVLKVALGIMELVEVAPKLDKLKLLLMENPYRPEDEMDVEELEEIEKDKTGLFRWEDLVDRIQASDEELRAGLPALSAVEIDGYWRIVDEKYVDIVLSMLLHNASSFGIPHLSALRIWLGFSTFFSLIYIIIGFTLSLKDGINTPTRDYNIPGSKASKIFITIGAAANLVFSFNTVKQPVVRSMQKALKMDEENSCWDVCKL